MPLALRFLTCSTALLCSTLAHAAVPAGALHVQRAEIIDRQGFDKPLTAATMMVPAGWRQQGQVEWKPGQRCGPAYALRLQAQAPDGSAAIELLPGDSWQASDMPGAGDCPTAQFSDARDYLTAWVQRHRPGARVLDYRPRPDRSRPEVQHAMPGGGMRQRHDAGQLLIGYSQNGREMRETLVAVVSIVQSQMQGLQPGSVLRSLHGQSLGVLAWRAPEGQLDFRHFDAVWSSLRQAEPWRTRIQQGEAQMARDNVNTQVQIGQIQAQTSRQTLAEMARRGEQAAQTRAEIAQINQGTWQAGQASQDRRQTEAVRVIREVEAYRAPGGGVVELPGHYPHAWQLRDGSYLLTDNPQFDPGRDIGQPGVALSRAAPK